VFSHGSVFILYERRVGEDSQIRHGGRSLPVDSPGTLVRLDVHLVEVDVHLGDIHLEAVGQQLDGLPHGAIARPPRQGEQGLGPNVS